MTGPLDEIKEAMASADSDRLDVAQDLANLGAMSVFRIEPQLDQHLRNLETTRKLRESYATKFFWLTAVQLCALNLVGWTYLFLHPDHNSLRLMIGGTMLQVFGVVLIITKSLFPTQNKPKK